MVVTAAVVLYRRHNPLQENGKTEAAKKARAPKTAAFQLNALASPPEILGPRNDAATAAVFSSPLVISTSLIFFFLKNRNSLFPDSAPTNRTSGTFARS